MNKAVAKIGALLVPLVVVSCSDNPIYSGFKKMDNGAHMKFYEKSDDTVNPRLKDAVRFEMAQYFNDSLLFSTSDTQPLEVILEPGAFQGDVTDALLNMHVGDSARVVMLADSIFVCSLDAEIPEEYAGKPLYYDIKLLSIRKYEEIEAERHRYLDSLRLDEQNVLDTFRNNKRNVVTESGLIILEKSGKGPVAKVGEYVDFDFTISTLSGDTIMNSFGTESVDVQFGEEFVSVGFTEALGMLSKGGRLQAVLPSALAFDSTGYQSLIPPYSPLCVVLKMNDIMSKEAHDKMVEEKEAKRVAEHEKVMEKERQLISKYVKDNGILEQPRESGLYLIWDEKGTGDNANLGDKVAVHYSMYNLNGELIESSYAMNVPMQFTIGAGEMIPAIEEAVREMNPGSRVKLIVPSELGFGEYEIDPVMLPADTPLLMDLELVSVE